MTIGIFLLAIAVVLVGLSVWILKKYQKSPGIIYYSGFLLGLGLIGLTDALLYLLPAAADIWIARTGYVFGALTFAMLVQFTANFPTKLSARMYSRGDAWLGPLLVFIPFFLLNADTVRTIVRQGNGFVETHGTFFWIFPVFAIGYGILAIVNLCYQLRSAVGNDLRRVRIFLAALILTVALASVFDVLLPALGHPRYPIGINGGAGIFALSVAIIVK